jgi:hypothetical protein
MSETPEPRATVLNTPAGLTLVPDPSQATLAALERRETALRALLRAETSGQTAAILARLDAMDRAIVVFTEGLTRVPTEVDRRVGGLQETITERFATVEEKFRGVQQQFHERDTRVKDAAEATDAALILVVALAMLAVAYTRHTQRVADYAANGAAAFALIWARQCAGVWWDRRTLRRLLRLEQRAALHAVGREERTG